MHMWIDTASQALCVYGAAHMEEFPIDTFGSCFFHVASETLVQFFVVSREMSARRRVSTIASCQKGVDREMSYKPYGNASRVTGRDASVWKKSCTAVHVILPMLIDVTVVFLCFYSITLLINPNINTLYSTIPSARMEHRASRQTF